jgi:hypothetical protein
MLEAVYDVFEIYTVSRNAYLRRLVVQRSTSSDDAIVRQGELGRHVLAPLISFTGTEVQGSA